MAKNRLEKAADLDSKIDYYFDKKDHSIEYNKTVKYNKRIGRLLSKRCKLERKIQADSGYDIDNEKWLNPQQKRDNRQFHEMDVLYYTFIIGILSLVVIVLAIAAIQQLMEG